MPPSLESLPDELKIEILTRLPAKSLICLSAVSKPWLSFLSTSEFVSAHLSNRAAEQSFFTTTTDAESGRFALIKDGDKVGGGLTVQFGAIIRPDMQFQNRVSFSLYPLEVTGIEIVGSFDGLLCLTFIHADSHPSIILWNPSIRTHVVLPPPIIHTQRKECDGIGVCVASNGDYRVVWVHEKHDDNAMSVEIYSLRSGDWRIRRFDHDLFPTRWLLRGSAFVAGKMHWVGCEYDESWIGSEYEDEVCDIRDICSITSFHIEEEVFRDVPLPDRLKGFEWQLRSCVAVVGESLGMIERCGIGNWDIWVMQDYGNVESWTRLYNIDIRDYDKRLPLIDALSTWKNPGVSSGAHQWLSYMDHEVFTVYGEYGNDTFEYVAKYVESLVLLGHKDAVADVHLLQSIAGCIEEDNAGFGQEI
ncbi:unnamed protein product [Cuscuta epithymum]|uniref:F-box domain-containing protein n=1 Tax=Cuscuta epithymum TaxID=186058 RepID=A0AAV0EF98_9ASTE|nr:unnamed protein product [Cuscuta epithymum]